MPDETRKPGARAPRALSRITPDQALDLARAELDTLQRWLEIDPDSPYRDETAARLRDLAERIERQV